MPSKVPVKCAIPGCHRRIKMTLAEREGLRQEGSENNATAGLVCPAHVKAAFNFEFDDIDIDVPLGELLVEAFKENPRWRVMLTPLPGAAGEAGQPVHARAGRQDHIVHPRRRGTPGRTLACSGEARGMASFSLPLLGRGRADQVGDDRRSRPRHISAGAECRRLGYSSYCKRVRIRARQG